MDLLVLIVFKYGTFLVVNLDVALTGLGLRPVPVPRLLLPIGISFFVFHAISYVVDVHRRDATAQKSPVHAALYLLLFPQLIAGPIIRYRDIADQLHERRVTLGGFSYGVGRFVVGLAKKVLIANVVGRPADAIFGTPAETLSSGHAWFGAACYTLQIYYDFSGYSDMAVGLGAMFGFRFPENFRWPYSARTVQDFWRRWHMSLSSWFRDYLYLPLGGNRGGPARTYRNLATVFLLCGLWHGASWTFVVWGLWHGSFLILERVAAGPEARSPGRTARGGAARELALRAYTLAVVMIGWVFFRADTLAHAGAYLRALAGLGNGAANPYALGWYLTPELWLALAAGALGSFPWTSGAAYLAARPRVAHGLRRLVPAAPWLRAATLTLLLIASALSVAAGTYDPFIYFRF